MHAFAVCLTLGARLLLRYLGTLEILPLLLLLLLLLLLRGKTRQDKAS